MKMCANVYYSDYVDETTTTYISTNINELTTDLIFETTEISPEQNEYSNPKTIIIIVVTLMSLSLGLFVVICRYRKRGSITAIVKDKENIKMDEISIMLHSESNVQEG